MIKTKLNIKKLLVMVLITIRIFGNYNVLSIGVPKCGSHLLEKLVARLTRKQNAYNRLINKRIIDDVTINPDTNYCGQAPANASQLFTPSREVFDQCTNLKPNEYLTGHLTYSREYEDLLKRKKFKVVLIIRDPRDQIISRIYAQLLYMNNPLFHGLRHLSFSDLIFGYIGAHAAPDQNFDDLYTQWLSYPNPPKNGAISHIDKFYRAYTPWMHSPICYTTKFENLVGPKGGGTKENQIKEIIKIARHIGVKINYQMAVKIADELFGNTVTFRQGKKESWRMHFSEDHVFACKQVAGQLLIELGYEKDLNWK